MRRKLTSKLLLALLAVSAFAFQASAADCHRKTTLKPAGSVSDASGQVDVRSSGDVQRFKLDIDASVPDGTTYVLYIDNLATGTVTFLLHAGEVEFNNNNRGAMRNGVDACSLSAVELRDASNQPVAIGTF